MLGVLESVADLAAWSITVENAFSGPWFKFAAIIFRYESLRLTPKNLQFVVIRLITDP